MKDKLKNKKNRAIENMLKLMDLNLSKLVTDDEDISKVVGKLLKKDKSDYTPSQLKELNKINEEINDMDSKIKEIRGKF